MRIDPGYHVGDILKFDLGFFNENERRRFHDINLERRGAGLIEIDHRDDTFTVIFPMYRQDITMGGKTTQELFITISPTRDNIDHRKLYSIMESPIGYAQAWLFPIFMMVPADKRDMNLLARHVSYTHSCPWCSSKIEAHIHTNSDLRFLCKSPFAKGKHLYNYLQNPSTGNYIAELTVDCVTAKFDSLSRRYFVKVRKENKVPTIRKTSNTPYALIYENLVYLVKRKLIFC